MSSSIEAVAATAEPSFDFVSVLSAEQKCDVCHELHAAVYERRCTTCDASLCPDCSGPGSCPRCQEGACEPVGAVEPASVQPWVTRTPAAAAQLWSRLAEPGLVRARDVALQSWLSVRSFPLRSHANAGALALMLLFAVARADQRDA